MQALRRGTEHKAGDALAAPAAKMGRPQLLFFRVGRLDLSFTTNGAVDQ